MKKAQMILSFAIALALWGAVTYYATTNIGDTVLSPLYYRIPIWIIIGVAFFTHLFYAAELNRKFRETRACWVNDCASSQSKLLCLIPNPPKDTDGRREESGREMRELQGK